MGKKLKVPASVTPAAAEQPATPAQPTVADQAAELIESDDALDVGADIGKDNVALPFSLSCDNCVAGGGIETPEQAAELGWTGIREDAEGITWNYLGRCPVCAKELAEAGTVQPEIADSDVPVTPSMEAEPVAGKQPAAEVPPPPQPVTANEITTEQRDAYADALHAHWKKHSQWQRDVEAAKESHTSAAIVRSQADDARKLAKKHEDDALEELMGLLNDKPKEPTFAEVVAELVKKRGLGMASDQPVASSPSSTSAAKTSDAWRAVPITKLDLPDKLIERLQEDGLDTIGRLEDRRGEISEGKAKWPKGIGQAKITKIEDAVIAWLTQNRDQAVFQDLQGAAASTSEPGEGEAAAVPHVITGQDEVEAYADAINARAATFDVDDQGAMQNKTGGGYWERGFDHYDAGGELRTCDLPPSPAQDDFIRGWLSAGNLKAREEAGTANNFDEEPPAGEEPELQEAAAGIDGPALFNPDDI